MMKRDVIGVCATSAAMVAASLGLTAGAASGQDTDAAQEGGVWDVVTLRADPETKGLVLELIRESEQLTLRPQIVEVLSAAENIVTATIEIDAAGEVQVCPPEPEQPRVMIGVVTEALSAALGAQLGLGESDAIVVAEVVEGQPASEAGVCRYDVITAVDGVSPVTQDSLRERVEGSEPGERISLSLIREGRPVSCEVVVRAFEEAPAASDAVSPFLLQRLATDAWATIDYGPVRDQWMAQLELTPTIVTGQRFVQLTLEPSLSAEARLRAEVAAVRERLAAIEAILAEMESGGESAPAGGAE